MRDVPHSPLSPKDIGATVENDPALFANAFNSSRAVYWYKRGPYLPPKMQVGLEWYDSRSDRFAPDCFLFGDQFFLFLVRSGRISSGELSRFFPHSGSVFNLKKGRVSYTLPGRKDDLDGWPCFDPRMKVLVDFVGVCLKKRLKLFECPTMSNTPMRDAAFVAEISADGRLIEGNLSALWRFGFGTSMAPDAHIVKKP